MQLSLCDGIGEQILTITLGELYYPILCALNRIMCFWSINDTSGAIFCGVVIKDIKINTKMILGNLYHKIMNHHESQLRMSANQTEVLCITKCFMLVEFKLNFAWDRSLQSTLMIHLHDRVLIRWRHKSNYAKGF